MIINLSFLKMDVFSTKQSHVDVLLSPEALEKYMPILKENEIETTIVNDNWQKCVLKFL
jgi:hypothetical protein